MGRRLEAICSHLEAKPAGFPAPTLPLLPQRGMRPYSYPDSGRKRAVRSY